MLVKYWKNFKWFLFIPLIVFVFVFKISNVKAYVYKQTLWAPASNESITTSLSNNQNYVLSTNFSNAISIDSIKNYDYFVFKFGNYNVSSSDNFSISGLVGDNGGATISSCTQTTGTSGSIVYYCSQNVILNTQQTSLSASNVNTGYIYQQGALFYDNSNNKSTCYFSTDLIDFMICPIDKRYTNITGYEFNIRNGGYDNLSINISFNGLKYLFNNEVSDLTIEQQQTNTNLQYIYQYQQNDSTTGSTTQATSDFTQLAQDFNTELSGVNDLTQLVLLPISLFMDLSTDNCQPLHLQIPYVNMSVDLPCMKAVFNQYFSGLYSIFTTIMSAVICYWVAVKTGALIKEIVDCDNDRIEVVDL